MLWDDFLNEIPRGDLLEMSLCDLLAPRFPFARVRLPPPAPPTPPEFHTGQEIEVRGQQMKEEKEAWEI